MGCRGGMRDKAFCIAQIIRDFDQLYLLANLNADAFPPKTSKLTNVPPPVICLCARLV